MFFIFFNGKIVFKMRREEEKKKSGKSMRLFVFACVYEISAEEKSFIDCKLICIFYTISSRLLIIIPFYLASGICTSVCLSVCVSG